MSLRAASSLGYGPMLLPSARVVLIVVDRPLCSPRSPVAGVDALLRHREDVRGADAYSPRRRRCRLSGFGDKEEEKQGDGRRRFAFDEVAAPGIRPRQRRHALGRGCAAHAGRLPARSTLSTREPRRCLRQCVRRAHLRAAVRSHRGTAAREACPRTDCNGREAWRCHCGQAPTALRRLRRVVLAERGLRLA
jgi:hypothetical protein